MAVVLFWALDSCTDKASQSWICWQSNACWDCHSYFSELTKMQLQMLETPWIVTFLFLRTSVFTGSTFSSVWCVGGHCEFWMVSALVTLLFNLENHSQNLCSSPFLLYKSHLKLSNVSVACFSSLKQNLTEACCSFKSDFFQVFQNWKYVNTCMYT
jgi:hypothetical protein